MFPSSNSNLDPPPEGLRRMGDAAPPRLKALATDLEVLAERVTTIARQTRRRIDGEVPDGATRLVSLHDADARPIRKGRLGKPVEFGYKAQVLDNQDGVVLDHVVFIGNPPDAPMLVPAIERVASRTKGSQGANPRTHATLTVWLQDTCGRRESRWRDTTWGVEAATRRVPDTSVRKALWRRMPLTTEPRRHTQRVAERTLAALGAERGLQLGNYSLLLSNSRQCHGLRRFLLRQQSGTL